jgi:hypothetical protein
VAPSVRSIHTRKFDAIRNVDADPHLGVLPTGGGTKTIAETMLNRWAPDTAGCCDRGQRSRYSSASSSRHFIRRVT